MAFQIVDDVLDVIATDEQLGKPAGHDIAEGIYNLPVLHALEELGGDLGVLLGGPIDGADLDTARRLVQARAAASTAASTWRAATSTTPSRRSAPFDGTPSARRAGRRRHAPPRRRRRGPRRLSRRHGRDPAQSAWGRPTGRGTG